ncbi:MAG: hypothetical protein WC797_00660 [Candidatus Paceibacterota bacterium]|jgi:hypothetical protein
MSRIRKGLLFWLLFCLFVSCAFGSDNEITISSKSGKNCSGTLQGGLRRINELAKDSKVEDMWVFSEKTGMWYDVGENCEENRFDAEFNVLRNRPNDISGTNLVNVHIHPKCNATENIDPPSPEDIESHFQFVPEFRDKYKSTWRSMVCDGHGVWEVTASDRVCNVMNRPYKKGDRERVLLVAALEDLSLFTAEEHWTIRSRQKVVKNFITAAAKMGLQITFKELQ